METETEKKLKKELQTAEVINKIKRESKFLDKEDLMGISKDKLINKYEEFI